MYQAGPKIVSNAKTGPHKKYSENIVDWLQMSGPYDER